MSYAVARGYDNTKLARVYGGLLPVQMEFPLPHTHGDYDVIGTPLFGSITGSASLVRLTATQLIGVSNGTVDLWITTPRTARTAELNLSSSCAGTDFLFSAGVYRHVGSSSVDYIQLRGGASETSPVLTDSRLSPWYRWRMRIELVIAGDFATGDTVDLAITFTE